MDHHWAWKKQPAKPEHSSLADFDCGIRLFIHVAFVSWVKVESADMGNKTDFLRLGHI